MTDTAQFASADAIPRERSATAAAAFFAAAFALSGLFFLLYPAIRPFSSEVGLDGARAFASSAWIVAHTLGILGFILLALASFGLYERLRDTAAGARMLKATLLLWLGAGLTIPYYGAEVFGLHAAGQRAIAQNDPALVKPLIHAIRWEAGIWFIIIGLLLLAIGAIIAATAVWRSGRIHRWAGVPLAVGLGLYIPQFTGPQGIRVAHGVLMLVGCAWLGWSLLQDESTSPKALR
jgi:hypothetical protein